MIEAIRAEIAQKLNRTENKSCGGIFHVCEIRLHKLSCFEQVSYHLLEVTTKIMIDIITWLGNSKFQQKSSNTTYALKWDQNESKYFLVLGRPLPCATKFWGQRSSHPSFKIQCQKFVPEGLLTYETWNEDGTQKLCHIPPFAACDPEAASDSLKTYVRDSFEFFKKDMIEEPEPLVKLIFEEAIRFSENHQVGHFTG